MSDEVLFEEIEELFWRKTKQRLEDPKVLSDAAMARTMEYLRGKQEVELARQRQEQEARDRAERENPVQTIMEQTGLPVKRRLELLTAHRENILAELSECDEAIRSLDDAD